MNLEAREEEVGWPKKVWATMPDFLEAEKGGVNRVATRIHSVWFIKNTVSLRIDHFSYGKILQEQLGRNHTECTQSHISTFSIMNGCLHQPVRIERLLLIMELGGGQNSLVGMREKLL